ncbi:MAG: hypothetical protein HYW90_02060 [Candidatus Sungbacteria bacterium]|nr:hypothetical protein [Candidatus Sungbacteria bacterium]
MFIFTDSFTSFTVAYGAIPQVYDKRSYTKHKDRCNQSSEETVSMCWLTKEQWDRKPVSNKNPERKR